MSASARVLFVLFSSAPASITATTLFQGHCGGHGVRQRVADASQCSSSRLYSTANCCFQCVTSLEPLVFDQEETPSRETQPKTFKTNKESTDCVPPDAPDSSRRALLFLSVSSVGPVNSDVCRERIVLTWIRFLTGSI